MAEDRVLRCLVHATIDDKSEWRIIDCVEESDCFLFVLEWMRKRGEEKETPAKQAGLPKEHFEVISDPNIPYALRCKNSVNFDKIPFRNSLRNADDVWRKAHTFYQPRPSD
jgi:hypothetical protein